MDVGIGYLPTADAVGRGEIAAFVEERGFGSLVFAEHTHIPASSESPWPGGGELPRKYTATLDRPIDFMAMGPPTRRCSRSSPRPARSARSSGCRAPDTA